MSSKTKITSKSVLSGKVAPRFRNEQRGDYVVLEISDGDEVKWVAKPMTARESRTGRFINIEEMGRDIAVRGIVRGVASKASNVALPYKPDSFSVRELERAIKATRKI